MCQRQSVIKKTHLSQLIWNALQVDHLYQVSLLSVLFLLRQRIKCMTKLQIFALVHFQ